MTWSYDNTNLDVDTSSGRLNIVRFLLGDTDTNDQKLQDEEIYFSINLSGNNVYSSASFCATSLSAKYASLVDTTLDNAITVKYSGLKSQYSDLAIKLDSQAKKVGAVLGVKAGGVVAGSFSTGQFRNPQETDYE